MLGKNIKNTYFRDDSSFQGFFQNLFSLFPTTLKSRDNNKYRVKHNLTISYFAHLSSKINLEITPIFLSLFPCQPAEIHLRLTSIYIPVYLKAGLWKLPHLTCCTFVVRCWPMRPDLLPLRTHLVDCLLKAHLDIFGVQAKQHGGPAWKAKIWTLDTK